MNYKSPVIPVVTLILSVLCYFMLQSKDGTKPTYFLLFAGVSLIRLAIWAYIKYVKKMDNF